MDPIDEFWAWWRTARQPLAAAIGDRSLHAWEEPLSRHVNAIDPALSWELGPGVRSAHHLCVTSEGNAALRVTAERWLSRAPAPDALWEYYPARQPSRRDRKLTLTLAGVDLSFDELRIGLETDEIRRFVHVRVYHPRLRDLPQETRPVAMFLMLDDLLGEDGVERWIGTARVTLDAVEAPHHRDALFDAVRQLSAMDSDSFTLLTIEHKDGRRKLAAVNFGIKRLDHLLMDVHFEVTIEYPDRGDGFYTEVVGEDVNAMEDVLVEQLGPNAVYIGRETGLGRRVVHLHAAGNGPVAGTIAHWERMYPSWGIETVARLDPKWDVMRQW